MVDGRYEPAHEAADMYWKERQMKQLVTLVKVDGVIGPLEIGAQFDTQCDRLMQRDDAVRRAYRLLKRSYPLENPACWEVSCGST